ncbi:MAG TPA: hypothetical protein VM221_04940 [Armatimonadota bacterium]|nr:hypothetical protein [Armatimonadota bacterium]
MGADTGWIRLQLAKWHAPLAQDEGDLALFWRRIWCLRWDEQQYCVKLPRQQEDMRAEADLLRGLHVAGYPVPQLHWHDEDSGVLVMEWIEGPSLEDVLKQPKSKEREAALESCIQGLAHVERATRLVEEIMPLQEPTVPDTHEFATSLMRLTRQIGPGIDEVNLQAACQEIAEAICVEPRPTLGIVDILPRDVILGSDGAVFLDFWPIGWWWSEKRFCQYFARFQQDAGDRAYQSTCFLRHFLRSNAARLDAHYLWHDVGALNAWQEIRNSPEETNLPRDVLDSLVSAAITAAQERLTWHGASVGANEVRSMLCNCLSG